LSFIDPAAVAAGTYKINELPKSLKEELTPVSGLDTHSSALLQVQERCLLQFAVCRGHDRGR